MFNLNITLPAQFVMTGSIVAIAAGLGAMAGHLEGHFPAANRWVLCAGAAVYFLTSTVMGVHGGAPRRWVLGWGLPAVSVCVLLGSLGGPLPAWALAAVIAAVALWLVAYRRFDPGYRPAGLARRARRSPTGDAP